MGRFHYRMQSILDIKEKLETRAKQQFQEAQLVVDEEKEKLEKLHQRKKAYLLEEHLLLTNRIDVVAIKANQNAMKYIEEAIKHQNVALTVANKKLEKARNALREVMQERKAHERLKEKAFDDFKMEESRKESKEIDELTTYRHGQKILQETDKFTEMDR